MHSNEITKLCLCRYNEDISLVFNVITVNVCVNVRVCSLCVVCVCLHVMSLVYVHYV